MQYSKASSISSSHDEILMSKLIDKSSNIINSAYEMIHQHIKTEKTNYIKMKLVLSEKTHNEVLCFATFMKCQGFKVEVENYGENFERAFNGIRMHSDNEITDVMVMVSWN